MKAQARLEDGQQIALMDWAGYQRIEFGPLRDFLIAVPNGAHLAGDARQRAMQMARLKRLGLQPGVADICLPVPRRQWGSLWIEMKTAVGRLTPEQQAFGERMLGAGNLWLVARSAEEAMHVITEYLASREPRL